MSFKTLVLTFILVLIISTIALTAPLKIGVIYLNPITDNGWTTAHHNGITYMQKYFGNKVDVRWVDGVGSNYADIYSTLESLIATGSQLIFSTAWDFMDATIDIAKKYPNVVFEHCSGYKRSKNVGTYFVRIYNFDYLAGIVAGRMTKKGLIGLVLPQPIPEVVRQADAFALGVKRVNPKAKIKVVWVHSWYDPAKEAEFARTLIESGVDVLAHGCDSPAASQMAEKMGVYTIGYGLDQSRYAPTKWLTAPLWNWGKTYVSIVNDYMNGKWQSKAIWDKYGARLAPISGLVDSETKAIVQSEYDRIFNQEYNIFTGPLVDNHGKVKYKKGEEMTDDEIWGIYFLLDNIEGVIPK